MIPKCCCGPDPCTYASDLGPGANETPLGAPWTKLAGNDWNRTSNVIDAVRYGTYKHGTAWPGGATDSRHASVQFKLASGTASGTVVEILQGIAPDAFLGQPYDWFYAFVKYSATGCSSLGAGSFYHGLGGTTNPGPGLPDGLQIPTGELTLDAWHTLEICLIQEAGAYGYNPVNRVICKITLANGKIYSATSRVDNPQTIGDYGGLRVSTGSTSKVQFRNFKETYYRNSPTNQHRTCPWCHTGCDISSDAFTTDDPCKWDVISGSYTVSGGLMTLGATPSKIQHHFFHPGLKTTHKVTVDVQDNTIESKVYIGNGYAKLTYSGGLRTLTLYDNSNNVLDTDAQTVVVNSDSSLYMALTLCYSRGVLSCTVTGRGSSLCVDAVIAETTDPTIAYWASLGGNSGAVFDNFVFSKTYDATAPADTACDTCAYCPATCLGCCTSPDPAGAYIVDLGAGGWTTAAANANCSCNDCAGANGEFEVVGDNCGWQYTDQNCNFDFCCDGCAETTFGVQLRLYDDGTGHGCKWEVVVGFTNAVTDPTRPGNWSCTAASGIATATFVSGYLTGTDQCNNVPVTLNKTSENAVCPCTGSLPATITLRAA